MKKNKIALDEKYNLIRNKLGDNTIIYFDDIRQLFPEKKTSSLYWDMYKLVDAGYLKRMRNGVYKFNDSRIKRRDFYFNELTPKDTLDLFSKPIVSDTGSTGFIPESFKDYPLTHYLKIAS